ASARTFVAKVLGDFATYKVLLPLALYKVSGGLFYVYKGVSDFFLLRSKR
ncbi:11082_t:CDS:1, partial [Scutellospora calospora]